MSSSLQSVLQVLLLVYCCVYQYSVGDYLYPNIPSAPTLPEIIINKNMGFGYVYPVPQQPFPFPPPTQTVLPPLQDDIPLLEPPNGYLPPENSILPPSNDILPPQNDYLPTNYKNVYGQHGKSLTTSSPQVRVISMACLDSSQTRFFRTSIQSSELINSHPVLPKSTASSSCLITQKFNDVYTINLEGIHVGGCGVRYCADKKMCLNLRIPTIQGLKLPEDRIISLQCVPQSSTVSVVKSLGIKPQILQGRTRSLGTIATGGAQRPFEPHIAIYRRSNHGNEFNQLVETGSAVILGEELLLKATIKESEGWKLTRMGTLLMQQGVQGTTGRKAITLVDNDGCRVDSMKSICPEHPKQLNNLVTVFPFRAFLFQDGDSDEMLLSVRLFGCMHHEDCQAKHCEEKAPNNSHSSGRTATAGRTKRNANVHSTVTHTSTINTIANLTGNATHYSYDDSNNNKNMPNATHNERTIQIDERIERMHNELVQDYESHLDFRVVMPRLTTQNKTIADNENYYDSNSAYMSNIYNWYLITCGLLLTGIIGLTILNVSINHKAINIDKDFCFYDNFRKY